MNILRLGARKSALAQAQANWVADQLRTAFPDLKIEIVLITTSGDRQNSSSALVGEDLGGGAPHQTPSPTRGEGKTSGGLKALFTKEIEEALLDKRIDLAVHSLKDMAADLPRGLVIGAVPEREDARDAWISRIGIPLDQAPKGAKIGTGAVRRQAQLRHLRPDLEIRPLRGNVDTRLQKLADEDLDGILLAAAGLKRLSRHTAATELLSPETLVPAVGQGCLGIEIRERDEQIVPCMKALDHPSSHAAATAERAFLQTLGGSCQTPIAGYASIATGLLTMIGLVASPDGAEVLRARESGRLFDAAGVGQRLAKNLLAAGADKLLAKVPGTLMN